MREIFAVISVGIAIFLWQGRPLWKQKKKKEMAVFSSLLLMAVILNIVVALDLAIPSTAEVIGKILEPIVKPIVAWTKGGPA
jgi:hypothetical protein